MRVDLLKSIIKKTEATNVIILTHNIDLIFFQNVVIPSLRKCGHPSVTVFADSECAIDSFQRQGKWIDGIGRRYRIVPIDTHPGFRFHPKAVFVSGREKASLFIGSGNVGFGGWRENAEIWNRYDTDSDDTGIFNAFSNYLNQIAESIPLNDSILEEIWESFDPTTRTWSENLNPPVSLIGKVNSGESLIDQMSGVLGNQIIDKLIICTPYFDLKGEMINELSGRFNAKSTEVLVQFHSTNLTQNAVDNFNASVVLRSITFIGQDETQSFLHAKFFAFQHGELVTVFSGSANCSKAALLIPGSKGNVELMSYSTISIEQFEREYISEMKFLEATSELKSYAEEEADDTVSKVILILGCRYDIGVLHIAFKASEDIAITKCIVDGNPIDIKTQPEGRITININYGPSKVKLEGEAGSETIFSQEGWVDHEMELRATSNQRKLANSIHQGVNSENWNITVWHDILGLFYQHLKYLPKKNISPGSMISTKADNKLPTYSIDDIFTQGYGLPRQLIWHNPNGESGRLDGLQSMLLSWFGIGLYKDGLDDKSSDEDDYDNDDEETVDRVEKIKVHSSETEKTKPTDIEKRRISKIIYKLVDALTKNDYLKERHLPQLMSDLAIISLLLRSGLKENWIDHSDFLLFTHKVWSKLFFSSEAKLKSNGLQVGWLEYRYNTCTNKEKFIEQLADTKLSTAMTSWALALNEPTGKSEEALFIISCGISIAKFPWLWIGRNPEILAKELQKELIHAGELEPGDEQKWESLCVQRENLIKWGFALRELEKVLIGIIPGEVKDNIIRKNIRKGELLWQGKAIGYCIAGQDCDRNKINENIIVHCLQYERQKANFRAPYIIPLECILSEKIIKDVVANKSDRNDIINLIKGLTDGFKNFNS